MTRTRASVKRRKPLIGATPSQESPAADDDAHEPSTAANEIGCSVDLLTEILLRSPAKSLIRFKCVSKNWLSLISDSQFATDHSRRNPKPSISGLYFYSDDLLKSVSLNGGERNLPSLSFIDVLGRQDTTRIAGSCNGLLLCKIKNVDIYAKGFVTQYVVCNVSTQKYRILPKPSGNPSTMTAAFLAFDPSKSSHYKVVLFRYERPPPHKIHIYSSQTGGWKQVFAQHTCHSFGAYWNGAIHWVSDGNVRLRFDVDAEEMVTIRNPQPPKLLSRGKIRYLGECGGRLFLIQCRSRKVLGFRILELCNNWWGSYQVNFRPIILAFPELERNFEFDLLSMLCVGDVKKKEDFKLVLAIPGRIISYNLHWKTFDVLCDLSKWERIDPGRNGYAYPFIETLSPV